MYLPQPNIMLVAILFWLLLALCCSFAAVAGGSTGKTGAAMLIISTLATTAATTIFQPATGWSETHVPVMAIDILLLCGLYMLALRSEAYWPLWATGFHLLTVSGHFATIIMPDFRLGVYFRFSSLWSLLVLMSMVVGISIDRSHPPVRSQP